MRLGVLDVGSNTVHMLVVDARAGAAPIPAYSHKTELRLAEHLGPDDAVTEEGIGRLIELTYEALEVAEDRGCASVLAFATSAIREANNGDAAIRRVREHTGVDLRVLTGEQEARLTFLAVRRWYGWSARQLLLFDIGGGSLEIASGADEDADLALSTPLGAGRLTREFFTGDPPSADEVRELRRHVRAEIAQHAADVVRLGTPDYVVGTSKTFRQLARICGAAPAADGPFVKRWMAHSDVAEWVTKLAGMTAAERAELPGVSAGRAPQALAGAIVADAAMDLFGVEQLEICPWALREGVILRHLDTLTPDENGKLAPADAVAP